MLGVVTLEGAGTPWALPLPPPPHYAVGRGAVDGTLGAFTTAFSALPRLTTGPVLVQFLSSEAP